MKARSVPVDAARRQTAAGQGVPQITPPPHRALVKFFFFAIAIPLILGFASCEPLTGDAGEGNVTIALPGGDGRATVEPAILARLVYTMTFSGPGGEKRTRTTGPGSESVRINLDPGDWTVSAEAFLDAALFGTGSAAFTVRRGGNTTVTIAMRFSAAAIDVFTLDGGVLGAVDKAARTVTFTVPYSYGTLNGLVPAITVSEGAVISPPSGAARDFTYPVTYTVTAADGSVAIWTVKVNVNADLTGTLTTPDLIGFYLAAAPGGSLADPVALPAEMTLDSANWNAILTRIAAAGKYVNLDLSLCSESSDTSGGGFYSTNYFDPDNTNAGTGKGRIVRLVLPDAVQSVTAGTSTNAAFRYFTALKSVEGEGVITIGDFAFTGITTLTTAVLPDVETIGLYAFSGCTGLAEINLPASLLSITGSFSGCTNLTSITVAAGSPSYKHSTDKKMLLNAAGDTLVAYPSASGAVTTLPGITTIDAAAFSGCTGLTSVTLPAVTSVSVSAFAECTGLVSADFQNAVTIGSSAFSGCTALETVNIPAASDIAMNAFQNTGAEKTLTVTLGTGVPTLSMGMFDGVTGKNVTVRVPSGASAWAGILGSYTTDTASSNWGNGFRGGGWSGTIVISSSSVNGGISLTVED